MIVSWKQIPTLIVIGVTGFVGYTTLFPDGDSGSPQPASKPPPPGQVAPAIASNTMRNPFQREQAASASLSPPLSVSGPSKDQAGATSGGQANRSELPALPADEDQVLGPMKLAGTFVDRREQLAIIDGHVYVKGDQLRGADGATLPYVVTEIRKDRALVRRGRRDFVIGFSDVPRPGTPRTTPKPAEARTTAKEKEKTETVAKSIPIGPTKPGPGPRNPVVKPPTDDVSTQRDLLLQLLSSVGGQGGPSATANPLAGLGSSAGLNSSALNSLINPTTLGAGLDAIMGKNDIIGQLGGNAP